MHRNGHIVEAVRTCGERTCWQPCWDGAIMICKPRERHSDILCLGALMNPKVQRILVNYAGLHCINDVEWHLLSLQLPFEVENWRPKSLLSPTNHSKTERKQCLERVSNALEQSKNPTRLWLGIYWIWGESPAKVDERSFSIPKAHAVRNAVFSSIWKFWVGTREDAKRYCE